MCYINGHYVGDAEVTDMTLLGWHFLRDDCRLQFSPHTLVEPGQTLTVEPPLDRIGGMSRLSVLSARRV